jgi:hypothetical protein
VARQDEGFTDAPSLFCTNLANFDNIVIITIRLIVEPISTTEDSKESM